MKRGVAAGEQVALFITVRIGGTYAEAAAPQGSPAGGAGGRGRAGERGRASSLKRLGLAGTAKGKVAILDRSRCSPKGTI